jgi:hypothetical protein
MSFKTIRSSPFSSGCMPNGSGYGRRSEPLLLSIDAGRIPDPGLTEKLNNAPTPSPLPLKNPVPDTAKANILSLTD